MKRVLLTPLDWGLGHATRCIPIIRELLKRSCIVYVAASGDSLILLKREFPLLTFFFLPGYNPQYPSSGNMVLKMALQLPKFMKVIKKEHEVVEALVKEFNIDLVISDNRYGCWSSKITTVIITHQLNILMPIGMTWLSKGVRILNQYMIRRFSYCWIPDNPGSSSLAGKLTHYNANSLKRVMHIGPLSRFSKIPGLQKKYDVFFILSGPESQRSIFEKIVKGQLKDSGLAYFIVRGIPSISSCLKENEAEFLNSDELQTVIQQSSVIIARSGYSTIMDLCALGKKAIFIPTPSQTEQEYLAKKLNDKNITYCMPQHSFDLKKALKESKTYSGFTDEFEYTHEQLNNALNQILSCLK